MKRKLFSVLIVAAALGAGWLCLGQAAEEKQAGSNRENRNARWQMWRERQLAAITTAQEELGKIKDGIESFSMTRENWQDLSDEERGQLRDKFRKQSEQRQQSLASIEQQVTLLKGGRQLRDEFAKSISDLETLLELAKSEDCKKVAAKIEELIAAKKKDFEETSEKLGLQRTSRRSRD